MPLHPPTDVLVDGTALAVAVDNLGHRQVYLAGMNTVDRSFDVWRMDGSTMAFTLLPRPFAAGTQLVAHPRLRIFGGRLYIVGVESVGGNLMGNWLDATTSGNWQGMAALVTGVAIHNQPWLSDGRTVNEFIPFSFDLGNNAAGQARLRLLYKIFDSGSGRIKLASSECQTDLTGCVIRGWSTAGVPGDQFAPSLKYGGGYWGAMWWSRQDDPSGVKVTTIGGQLDEAPEGDVLRQVEIYPAVNRCSVPPTGASYWADYNELYSFEDSRFFAPYTVNGPGCRWQGKYTADMHVGGSIFRFIP